MILQTSLWQFVKFTCTDLGPAFANWARNWYWSPHREIPNCDSPHMKESPHCSYEKADHPLALKNELANLYGARGYHVRRWLKINLNVYNFIICLNKNLVTHFVWYLEKEKRYDIETLSIDRVLNKKHLYGNIMWKMCTKSQSQTSF